MERDTSVIEVRNKSMRIILASMYLDIKEEIKNKIAKVEEIIKFLEGTGVLIAMDSVLDHKRGTTNIPIHEAEYLKYT